MTQEEDDPCAFTFDEHVFRNAKDIVDQIYDREKVVSDLLKTAIISGYLPSELEGKVIALKHLVNNEYAHTLHLAIGSDIKEGTLGMFYRFYENDEGVIPPNMILIKSHHLRYLRLTLFHEIIHHIDHQMGKAFVSEKSLTSDHSDRTQRYREYFNTAHEQRAYFHEGVYTLFTNWKFKVAHKLGMTKYRAVFDHLIHSSKCFSRFNRKTLTQENSIYHTRRVDNLFNRINTICVM